MAYEGWISNFPSEELDGLPEMLVEALGEDEMQGSHAAEDENLRLDYCLRNNLDPDTGQPL
ncbi:MAG TPA: hypothetical protein VFT53_00205 [Candidatus Saccharimonadales bacterium]|nr:hypothetical protein [Candidatus Saccharimonadales bacterium]